MEKQLTPKQTDMKRFLRYAASLLLEPCKREEFMDMSNHDEILVERFTKFVPKETK